jgi:uncharacterized protein YkwD
MNRIKQALKKYFIPHQENDHKPHILRPRTIAFVFIVAIVAESTFVLSTKYILPQSKLFGIVEVNALVDGTNQNRVANNLPDLQVSPLLMAAAQDKANDEATRGYFAHTSPQGITPWYWFQQAGYNYLYAGENLAVNFTDSQNVVTAWMNSPEHRANILSTQFTQVGIATAQGIYNGQPAIFVAEEFGTPAPAPIAFVNTASAATMPTTAPAVTSTPKTVVPVAPAPTVIATQSSSDADSQQTFVAVSAGTQEGQSMPTATSAPASTVAASGNSNTASVAQSNIIQLAFSDPKAMTDDFYFIIMIIFAAALILNIFIKIRVQYSQLIACGALVIVVAGLFIMLNQNIGLLHVAIL